MPPFFARLLHLRLSNARSANVLRKTLLGHRFTAPELLEEGIVDEIVPGKQLQERAIAFGNEIGQKSKGGSWGEMKVRLLSH
jgi:enoyl-CoA hydratase/carnithine racemase